MTAGEEMDEEAFREVLAELFYEPKKLTVQTVGRLRVMWDAGKVYGLELRGCCSDAEEEPADGTDY